MRNPCQNLMVAKKEVGQKSFVPVSPSSSLPEAWSPPPSPPRRLYSYVLWWESSLCKTPHFQWIYGKLNQIYEKLRSDQMDPKSALGGPKPISRTRGSLLKDWSYTSNQCIYLSILLYWRPHLAKTLFILFIFYCIYGDSWKKYKSRAWRTWFWVSSRWDNIKRNVEPCKRSTLAFSMSYLFGKLSWTILLANCTHISTTTETVPYIDF